MRTNKSTTHKKKKKTTITVIIIIKRKVQKVHETFWSHAALRRARWSWATLLEGFFMRIWAALITYPRG
jgi:hypothetical protein